MLSISCHLLADGGHAADHIGLAQNLAFQTVGVAVVMGTLGCLAVLVAVASRVFQVFDPPKAVVKVVPAKVEAVVAAPVVVDADEETRRIVAVCAAVASVMDGPHRIVSVVPMEGSDDGSWGREGRRQIFQSKQVR